MSEKSQRLLFAGRQSELIIAALEASSPGALPSLRQDAIGSLSSWDTIQVVENDFGVGGADCSVAGMYTHLTSPPTISLLSTDSARRKQFTVLHELAHHFQKQDASLAASVRQQGVNHALFEESACDAFAAKVLIDEGFARDLGGRSPSASNVINVFQSTNASRAACSVWCAAHLGTEGVVTVLDSSGIVSFAAFNGSIFPPAKGSDQSKTPLVARALETGRPSRSDETFIQYRNGSRSALLYGDAEWADGYLIAVTVIDRPGWLRFAPPRMGRAPGHYPVRACGKCGAGVSWENQCPLCEKLKCFDGHCDCPEIAERVCQRCFMSLHPNLFGTAVATICIDCS